MGSPEARRGAERAAADRGDDAVRTVLGAAYKVRHEVHRILGFLRFRPDSQGTYIARCSPDHFVLPLLAAHFSRRFGDAPWLIIDEKRGLCLHGAGTGEPRLLNAPPGAAGRPGLRDEAPPNRDPWEDLWRIYHSAINNPRRNNPALQRQCIPVRYWKYLPELNRTDPPGAP
jgi:probable DNA metabolism protein